MIRVSLLSALFLGATLAATHSVAANPLSNRAWWTAALQGMQTQPSAGAAAVPAALTPVAAPPVLPSPGLLKLPGQAPGQVVDVGYDLCLGPIHRAERQHGIPVHLLRSIALAESGRWDSASARTVAWPWTINAEGVGHFFPSKAAAVAAAHKFRARGIKSIDVGCMQINMVWHPDAFASLDEAFDPERNVAYAASYLAELKTERKTWTEAVGYYHSATPQHNQRYRAKVMKLWADVQRKPDATRLASAAADSSRPMPRGFAQPAAGFTSSNWVSSAPRNSASVVALSSVPRAVSEGRRGMKLDQYRLAPTMPALDLSKSLVIPR